MWLMALASIPERDENLILDPPQTYENRQGAMNGKVIDLRWNAKRRRQKKRVRKQLPAAEEKISGEKMIRS